MLNKCIKVRVPTSGGWKDVRMELVEGEDFYYPLDGYDYKLMKKHMGESNLSCVECSLFTDSVETHNDEFALEVKWQGDSWPE